MSSYHNHIRDNRNFGSVQNYLENEIQQDSHLRFVSAYFSIFGFEALKKQLNQIKHLQFLFGEPTFVKQIGHQAEEAKHFDITDSQTLLLKNRLKQKAIAKACADWIKEKVEIRSLIQHDLLHGKLYHIEHKGGVQSAILGSANFTAQGLGCSPTHSNIELNLIVDSKDDCKDLKKWFQDLWNDKEKVKDVKQEVLNYLSQLYKNYSPQFIYYKTLFHLFHEDWQKNQQEHRAIEQSGLKNSCIWKKLLDFQQQGVLHAISKILNYNGCILADSVGLGKTYQALAIIKYFESRNTNVLVLCPKKLRDNWIHYSQFYQSKTNPFAKDRFHFKVLHHTDLNRKSGHVNGIDLKQFDWSSFGLIVIDESHHFRNDNRIKDKTTRYSFLLEQVLKKGIPTKVLLLSATPVNNSLNDLLNQIRLITADNPQAFSESLKISSVDNIVNSAEKKLANALKDIETTEEKIKKTAQTLNQYTDFARLLDAITIARSRKHIEKHYPEVIHKMGGFPKRNTPVSLQYQIDCTGRFPTFSQFVEQIEKYKLSLFHPSQYIQPSFQANYLEEQKVKNFTQQDRERHLIGMIKINFLKRLESSIFSLTQTLNKIIQKYELSIQQIKNNTLETLSNKKIRVEHLNKIDFLLDLETDLKHLRALHQTARAVNTTQDHKLQVLKEKIIEKLLNPTQDKTGRFVRKILIFTAFADTAYYLYEQISVLKQVGIHCGLVTGSYCETTLSTPSPAFPNTTLSQERLKQCLFKETIFSPTSVPDENWADEFDTDNMIEIEEEIIQEEYLTNHHYSYNKNKTNNLFSIDEILSLFSPISKQKTNYLPTEEIDILIATDCISEGQNLQDCDWIINYDIHWNPVRLIQRFGRIDRLGSQHHTVSMLNFWVTDDLDHYLRLKDRVISRMALVDSTATGSENILDQEQQPIPYREAQLKKMREEVLDLEDINDAPEITDLNLDIFRTDLDLYLNQHTALLKKAPLGLYGIVPAQNNLTSGVIFCLRQNTQTTSSYQPTFFPYFLIYIKQDGSIQYYFEDAKKILEIFQTLCMNKDKPYEELCQWFDNTTDDGNKMETYDHLLQKGIEYILKSFNENEIGGVLNKRQAKFSFEKPEKREFTLITWLIIQDENMI